MTGTVLPTSKGRTLQQRMVRK